MHKDGDYVMWSTTLMLTLVTVRFFQKADGAKLAQNLGDTGKLLLCNTVLGQGTLEKHGVTCCIESAQQDGFN